MTKSFTKRCFSRAKRNMIQQQKSDPTQQHMYQGDKFQSISSLKLKTRGTSKQSQKVKASLGYSLPINISINGIYSQVLIKPPTSCHTVIYVIAHSLLPFTEKKRSDPNQQHMCQGNKFQSICSLKQKRRWYIEATTKSQNFLGLFIVYQQINQGNLLPSHYKAAASV